MPLDVRPIQDGANELRLRVRELVNRVRRVAPRCHLGTNDEHHAGGNVANERGIGDRHDRRRIDDDPVVLAAELPKQLAETRRAQKFRRIWRNVTGGQHVKVRHR